MLMKMNKAGKVLMLVLSTLMVSSLACSVGALGSDPTPTVEVEKLIRPTDTPEPTKAPPTEAPEPTQESAQPAGQSGDGYTNYVTIYDDFGVLTVDVPAEWTDVDGRAWAYEEEQIGASVWASSNIDGLNNNWVTPGLFFNVSNRTDLLGTPTQFLEEKKDFFGQYCDYDGRSNYEDPAFRGSMDRYSSCGGENSSYVVLVAEPISGPESYLLDLEVQLAPPADELTLERILGTFNVTGSIANLSGGDSGFITVTDDYNSIQVDVPANWTDVDGSYWVDDDQVIGATIYASADLDAFLNTWNEPGIIFRVSDDVVDFFGGYIMMLDWRSAFFRDGVCELEGRYDYEDELYEGKADWFNNCGGPGGPSYMVLSTRPINDPLAYNMLIEVQFEENLDMDYVTQILDTFVVTGTLP